MKRVLLALAALLACALPQAAWADVRTFNAGSLIIPMDSCFQPAVDMPPPKGCTYAGAATDGPLKAYGLVYLLLRHGVTVYIITDPNKGHITDPDMSIQHAGGGGPPVGLYDRATGGADNFQTQGKITYLGAPMVIDVSDAPTVKALLKTDPRISAFTSVAIHVAYDSFTAPVAQRMNGVPPRIAVFTPTASEGGTADSEGSPLMETYLERAGLNYAGAIGSPAAPGDIIDLLAISDLYAGALQNTYQIVWLPHYDESSKESGVLDALAAFADGGGLVFAECGAIQSFEKYAHTQFMTIGIAINALPSCYPGNKGGFNAGHLNPGNYFGTCWDPVVPLQPNAGSQLSFPVPAHPYVQIGDFPFFANPGEVADFYPSSGTWNAGVVPLLQAQDAKKTYNGRGILALVHKDNNPIKGQIIYFGGHLYGDPSAPATAGIRIVLNTLLFARPVLNAVYQARSQSTLATVGNKTILAQGTYRENNAIVNAYSKAADAATWPFPQVRGRYQAYDVSALAPGTDALNDTSAVMWEASALVPGANNRTMFTSSGTGAAVALMPLTSAGVAGLGANPFALPAGFVQADVDALVQKVRAAPLGGIDHSTSAILGPQPLVPGGGNRPSVAYVGALDGMLHAFVVDASTGSPPGTELWAYLPGDQLGSVRTNGAAVDGSPCAGDVYEAIGGSKRLWHTLVIVPQGAGGTAVYAMDVSDPLHPALLWVRGIAGSGVNLGNAGGAALGILPTPTNPLQSIAVLASSTPGGPSGITVTGLKGADGSQMWQFSHAYTRTLPGTPAVVPNGLPASAVLGTSGAHNDDRTYAADLEGRVWELDTVAGSNVNGTSPLADVGLDAAGHTQPIGVPPALYVEPASGHRVMVVITGGEDWAAPGDTYGIYAFDLDPSVRVKDTGAGVAPLLFHVALNVGEKGYAPPTVSGNDLYYIGSTGVMGGSISATLGDSATLYRLDLGKRAVDASQAVTKGAGGFSASAQGVVFGADARDLVVFSPAGANTNGTALRQTATTPVKQRLWLEVL